MKRFALVTILCSGLAARAERLPLQSDFDRCANAMMDVSNNSSLQGQLWLELLVRPDGKVYAAYVSNEKGIDNRRLERCLTSQALLWVLPPVPIHYKRVYAPISFAPGGDEQQGGGPLGGRGAGRASVFMPDINRPPPNEALLEKTAQATLDIAEFATTAEQGLAQLSVRRYPEAIRDFRSALALRGDDGAALFGLSQALAESGGDLKEARGLAQRLAAQTPDSEEGHEALIRVCLAQRDPACAVEQWKLAIHARDVAPRSRILKEELETAVRQAAVDLQARGNGAATAQGAQADPCAKAQGDEQMALCVVKRCLDVGSSEYAKELSQQNNLEYVAGEWRAKPVGKGRLLVTREIAARGQPAQQHNAIWLVKLGDQLVMQPTNSEARQITLTHNACASRVSAGK